AGSADLTPDALASVNREVLPQLEIAQGMLVRVEGNTDAFGDRRANQTLSERRARAIVDYLITRGISPKRVMARGNGSGNPIAPNGSAEGRAQNRRTDILFIRRQAG
ncbi:MAG TPA: OmpA family protein, partial [Polyangiaceae bacterium]|nr:OmpA family protein [Polyangiaceae bacterium]